MVQPGSGGGSLLSPPLPSPAAPLCSVGNVEGAEHLKGASEKIKRGLVFTPSLFL